MNLRRRLSTTNGAQYVAGPWPHWRGNISYTGYSQIKGQFPFYQLFRSSLQNSVSSSPSIDSNNTIWFGDDNCDVNAINGLTGIPIYTISLGGTCSVYTSPTLSTNGTVFIGTDSIGVVANVFAISVATGTIKWSNALQLPIRASIAVSPDGQTVYVVSFFLYALNADSGQEIWSVSLGSNILLFQGSQLSSSPVFFGDNLYVGSGSGSMYAFGNLKSNPPTLLWNYTLPLGQQITATPAFSNQGIMYFGSVDSTLKTGSIWAVNTAGSLVYKYPQSIIPRSSCSIDARTGVVYVGTGEISDRPIGSLVALRPDLSAQLWNYSMTKDTLINARSSGEIYSSPAVDSAGNIFFGSDNTFFYGLNSSGSLLSKIVTAGSIHTSPAIGVTGIIYFGTTGNDLWAVHAVPPSVPPVVSPVAAPTTNGLAITAIIGISVGVGCCGCLVFIICLFVVLRKSISHYEDGKEGMLSDIGGMIISGSTAGTRSRQAAANVAFNVDDVIIPQISWNDIKVPQVNKVEDLVLGKGSFGTVYRARLERTDPQTRVKSYEDVVVKVMADSVKVTSGTRSSNNTASGEKERDKKNLEAAKFEAAVVIETENRMTIKDSIIKVYGIAHGSIPPHLAVPLEIPRNCQAIGIVMRSESGGSLDALCHPKDPATPPIPMIEKLRLITELAKGIADMHAAGIIHGDLKPDNVLLSSDTPCKVRLADFGLATLRVNNSGMNQSTLAQTASTKGTPVYCAPEMFVNPYAVVLEDKVAKASRKTDMYAFALIAWEILTQKRPFVEVQKEMLLVAKIYSGERPSVNDIPIECPADVVVMIQNTWDLDRNKRGSAMECFNMLQYEYSSLSRQLFDVFISYEESSFSVAKYVSFKLAQVGIMVCLIPVGKRAQVTDELARSTVVVALLSKTFQETPECMAELNAARGFKPPKAILPVMLDTNYAEWADMQLIYLCQLNSSVIVKYDLSEYRRAMLRMSQMFDGNDYVASELMDAEVARVTEQIRSILMSSMSSYATSKHKSNVTRAFMSNSAHSQLQQSHSQSPTPSPSPSPFVSINGAPAPSVKDVHNTSSEQNLEMIAESLDENRMSSIIVTPSVHVSAEYTGQSAVDDSLATAAVVLEEKATSHPPDADV